MSLVVLLDPCVTPARQAALEPRCSSLFSVLPLFFLTLLNFPLSNLLLLCVRNEMQVIQNVIKRNTVIVYLTVVL